jgi:hypothetical protein
MQIKLVKGMVALKLRMQVSSFYQTRSIIQKALEILRNKFKNINIDVIFTLDEILPKILNLQSDGSVIYGDIIYCFWVSVEINIDKINNNFIESFVEQTKNFIENDKDIDLITLMEYKDVYVKYKENIPNGNISEEKDIFNVESNSERVLKVLNKKSRKIVILKKDGEENDN